MLQGGVDEFARLAKCLQRHTIVPHTRCDRKEVLVYVDTVRHDLECECFLELIDEVEFFPCEKFHLHLLGRVVGRGEDLGDGLITYPNDKLLQRASIR